MEGMAFLLGEYDREATPLFAVHTADLQQLQEWGCICGVIFDVCGVIIGEAKETSQGRDCPRLFPLLQGKEFARCRTPLASTQDVSTKLYLFDKKLAFLNVRDEHVLFKCI
jgi:hypothetical protein